MNAVILQANLFSRSNVGTDIDVSLLKKEITDCYADPNADNSNEGCWRSSKQYKNIDWLLENIEDLLLQSVDYYKNLDTVFDNAVKNKQYSITYWTNVNRPGSRNVFHSHSNADLSGVYYIQAEGTGDLRIVNPANMLTNCSRKSPFTRDFYFSPKDKDLIMWPSWLPHEVETNKSNNDRVNIAFDIRFI